MSKFHKLTKSNEIFTYTFSQQMEELKESISQKFENLFFDVGNAILSAIISFVVNLKDMNSSNKIIIIAEIIGYFFISFFIVKGFIHICKKLRNKDNKKNDKGIIELRNFFIQRF